MDRKLDQKQNLPLIYSPVTFKTVYDKILKAKADHTIKGQFPSGWGWLLEVFLGTE